LETGALERHAPTGADVAATGMSTAAMLVARQLYRVRKFARDP